MSSNAKKSEYLYFKKANIFGIKIASLRMQEAITAITKAISKHLPMMIVTANAEMLLRTTKEKDFAQILRKAELVIPDGEGTVIAARYLGYEMPCRVAGYDLVQELLRLAPQKKWRVFFLGGKKGVAQKAKEEAERLYQGINVVGVHDGYFTLDETPKIVAKINAKATDILLVALGVPKQEYWIFQHKDEINATISIGVGGTLDVMAGVMKRAPLWMQKLKLEWLFRGLVDPKRAGRLLALPVFFFKVFSYKRQLARSKCARQKR